MALVNLVTKPVIVPWLLRRTAPGEIYTRREIDQVLNIPTALLIALALVVGAFVLGVPLAQAVGPDARGPNVPIGIAAILLGAFTLTVRREAMSLLIGILAMENGAFFAGIAIAHDLADAGGARHRDRRADHRVHHGGAGPCGRDAGGRHRGRGPREPAGRRSPARAGRGAPVSVIAILLPPLVAAALIGLSRRGQWAAGATIVSCLAVLALAARMAWRIAGGGSVDEELDAAWRNWIAVDGLSALILLLVALVAAIAAIYSAGYMAQEPLPPGRLRVYYASYNLFVFSMLAIPLLAEPTLVWITVELTTLSSALLVAFENTREALEAAWKYVVLSLMGAGVALFGFLVLFAAARAGGGATYTWAGLAAAAPAMPPLLLQTAFLLILIGLGTKVGPGADAHLAAGCAQPGALAGVRAALGRRDHRRSCT